MQPLVSVIVSTYNVEEFIRESLNCIINQTLKDIEIICIDDCSSDNTLAILYQYQKKDDRIKIISQTKNEGLAVARNKAIKLVKGKYITFFDSDDLIDLDLLRQAYILAEKENSDMVMWDYAVFYNDKDLKINKNKPSQLNKLLISDKASLLKRPAFMAIKLIKMDIFKTLNINFPKGLTRQDIPIHWILITQLNRISILPKKLYFYRQQPNATTHKTDKRLFDIEIILNIVNAYLKKEDLLEKYKDSFLESQLNMLFGMYDRSDKDLKEEALTLILNNLDNEQWMYIHSTKSLRWQARIFYLSIEGSYLAKGQYHLWLISRKVYRLIKGIIK